MSLGVGWLTKPLCLLVIVSLLLFDLALPVARAGLIGTETVLNGQAAETTRARLATFLERQDVQLALSRQGVDPAEAKSRVASLADAEVARFAPVIDRLPAGGNAVGAILGAALFIFLILLITDILGLTQVFPFVRHPVR